MESIQRIKNNDLKLLSFIITNPPLFKILMVMVIGSYQIEKTSLEPFMKLIECFCLLYTVYLDIIPAIPLMLTEKYSN